MSNIGGPISPTQQITFSIDRLLTQSETEEDFMNNNQGDDDSEENNNNNINEHSLTPQATLMNLQTPDPHNLILNNRSQQRNNRRNARKNQQILAHETLHSEDDEVVSLPSKKPQEQPVPVAMNKSRKESLPPLAPKPPTATHQYNEIQSGINFNNNNNNALVPSHTLSPSLLNIQNKIHVGNTSVQVAVANSFSSSNNNLVTISNNNNGKSTTNQVNAALKIDEIKDSLDFFSRVIAFAQNDKWEEVETVCDALAEKIKSMLSNNNNNNNNNCGNQHLNAALQLRKECIERVQKEFDTAFDNSSKDIKRRHTALMIVCYLFAASGKQRQRGDINHDNNNNNVVPVPPIISEKIVVWALYRALNHEKSNGNNNNNSNTNNNLAATTTSSSTSAAPPPLHSLLSVAQGLGVSAEYFEKNNNNNQNNNNNNNNTATGMQNLPMFVSKLCNGLITSSPSKQQHEILCTAIAKQSAILHNL